MAPVTIKTNARGWYEGASTEFWSARVLHDTGSAIYAVVQDDGATARVRVFKGDAYPIPTSFSEVDGSNAASTNAIPSSFDSLYDGSRYIHVLRRTGAGVYTVLRFDTSTDTWESSNWPGASITADSTQTVRCASDASGTNQRNFGTSTSDDADIVVGRGQSGSFITNSPIVSLNSSDFSSVYDAGMYNTYAWLVYHDTAGDDESYGTYSSGGSVSVDRDLTTSGPTTGSGAMAGARYTPYDDGGTPTIMVAYLSSTNTLLARTVQLGVAASSATLGSQTTVEATAADVGTRTVASTARASDGTIYCAWWDDANSGTIYYATESGGTWTRSTFKTGVTMFIELVPVADGLAAVYQQGNDVVMDFIVAPSSLPISVNGSLATASAAANSGALFADIAGFLAAASATAVAGTTKTGYRATGSVASASATANSGVIAADTPGALAAATGTAFTGDIELTISGGSATAAGEANGAKIVVALGGAHAAATAAANDGKLEIDVAGLLATASARANSAGLLVGTEVLGSLATASAQAHNGTTGIDSGVSSDRYRLFQLRPLPSADEAI